MRNVFEKPPTVQGPDSSKDTDAPASTLSPIVQALFFTQMFTTESAWPGAWHDTLTADQLERRKTDKAAVPRGAGLAEFMKLAQDETARAGCVSAADEIFMKRPDLLAPLFPGIDVATPSLRTAYMDDALRRLPLLSIAQLHELVTHVGTSISRAMETHKHSGHVEHLPLEVSIPKSLAPSTLAVMIFVTYLAEEHDNGLDGVIYRNFSKFGRDGAGGSGNDTIVSNQSSNRTGGLSQADQTFLESQTTKLTSNLPSVTKVEAAFDAIAQLGSASVAGSISAGSEQGVTDARFFQMQEEAIIGARDEATLTPDEKTLVGEIRMDRVAAVRAALAKRKRTTEATMTGMRPPPPAPPPAEGETGNREV